jgi:hypothetical protein
MSVFESNSPRFCFKPRSMASCKESGRTPGTGFPGTDPANELPSSVPGKAAPGELEPGAVGVCAGALGEWDSRIPASRNVYPKLQMILKAASLAQGFLTPREQHPIPTRHSSQWLSGARALDAFNEQEETALVQLFTQVQSDRDSEDNSRRENDVDALIHMVIG